MRLLSYIPFRLAPKAGRRAQREKAELQGKYLGHGPHDDQEFDAMLRFLREDASPPGGSSDGDHAFAWYLPGTPLLGGGR